MRIFSLLLDWIDEDDVVDEAGDTGAIGRGDVVYEGGGDEIVGPGVIGDRGGRMKCVFVSEYGSVGEEEGMVGLGDGGKL